MIQFKKILYSKPVILLILFLTTTSKGFLQDESRTTRAGENVRQYRLSVDRQLENSQNLPIRNADIDRQINQKDKVIERLYDRRSFRTGTIERNSESRDVRTNIRDVNNNQRDASRNLPNIRQNIRNDRRTMDGSRHQREDRRTGSNLDRRHTIEARIFRYISGESRVSGDQRTRAGQMVNSRQTGNRRTMNREIENDTRERIIIRQINEDTSKRQQNIRSSNTRDRRLSERRNLDRNRELNRKNTRSVNDRRRTDQNQQLDRRLVNNQDRRISERRNLDQMSSRRFTIRSMYEQYPRSSDRQLQDRSSSMTIRSAVDRDSRQLPNVGHGEETRSSEATRQRYIRVNNVSKQELIRVASDRPTTNSGEDRRLADSGHSRIRSAERREIVAKEYSRKSSLERRNLIQVPNTNRASARETRGGYLNTRRVDARSNVDRRSVQATNKDRYTERRERTNSERNSSERFSSEARATVRRNSLGSRPEIRDQRAISNDSTRQSRLERLSSTEKRERTQPQRRNSFRTDEERLSHRRDVSLNSRSDSTRTIRDTREDRERNSPNRVPANRMSREDRRGDRLRELSSFRNDRRIVSDRYNALTSDTRRYFERLVSERNTKTSERDLATLGLVRNVDHVKNDSNIWANTAKAVLVAFLIAQILASSSKAKKYGFHNGFLSLVSSVKQKVQ